MTSTQQSNDINTVITATQLALKNQHINFTYILSNAIPDDWTNLNTKCNIPFL